MTDRSVPFILGKGTALRFDRADIKAIENAIGIGWIHFIDKGIFGSLTATEAFVWRGLREENAKGELVHIFPLNDKGREEAGEFVWQLLQDDKAADLNGAILRAFIASGPWKLKEAGAADKQPEEDPTGKNPAT